MQIPALAQRRFHLHSGRMSTDDAPPSRASGDWESLYTGHAQDYAPPDPLLLAHLSKLPPGRALDVGCGAGGLCVALRELGWRVTGIDISRNAIAAAGQVAQARGVDITFVAADAATWKPADSYELVTCHFGVPPSPDDRQAMYAMMRGALVPGGRVLMKFCEGNVSKMPAFSGYELLTLGELSGAFNGFEIAPPEHERIPAHRHRGHGGAGQRHHASIVDGGEQWTAVLFEARKPL